MSYQKELFPTFPFEYQIFRSKRKTLVIYVKSGTVEVRAPLRASAKWIDSFLQQKSQWIQRQLADQRIKLQQQLLLADGETIYFLGQARKLKIIPAASGKVEATKRRLKIYTPRNTPEALEKHLHNWLRQQAREYMGARTITIARKLGVEKKLKGVVFRLTKTKWGHCCSDGTIQFNWLTMMAPRPVIDYLIAHECSHLLHMNHSHRFWQTVARVCPNYETHRNWLHDHGHTFLTRPRV